MKSRLNDIYKETEEIWENLSWFHFVHHESEGTEPGTNPGLRHERMATNRLSHGMAYVVGSEGLDIFSL
jgi:hypothetical protein